MKFDERVSRNQSGNVSDWAPSHSPTALVARTVFWACVVLGFFIGVSAFDAAYPGESQISLFVLPYLTHSVGAVILLIAGTVIARFLARSVLIGAVNAKLQYARFLSMGVKWLMEGLEAISRNDPEAMQMFRAVRAIAWRTNYQQPFTNIRMALWKTNI